MPKKNNNQTPDINRKLDGLILLNAVSNLSGEEKLRIITNCIGLRKASRIVGRDPSNFSKSMKKAAKNEK